MESSRVEDTYDRLLASVGARASEIGDRPVVTHWPHVGSAYRGLAIVGQAVWGWTDDRRAQAGDEAPVDLLLVTPEVDRLAADPYLCGTLQDQNRIALGVHSRYRSAMPLTGDAILERRIARNMTFGRLAAAARIRAGLTQVEVAKRLGVPQTRIAKIELGKRGITFVEGLELAELYSVRPIDLDPRNADID